jgi:hypothetical protein
MRMDADKVPKDAREENIRAYAQFLDRKTWFWFFTLNMASGRPSRRRTELKFREWIKELRKRYGSKRFRYARVIETGRHRDNPHVHGMVGGLRNRRTEFEELWKEISGGDARIELYDTDKKAVFYMMKEMDDDLDIDLDFDFGDEGNEE